MGLNDLGGGVRAGGLRNLSSIEFSAIPDSGVSRYEFEQDVTDSWGSNDGLLVGSPSYTTTAKVGAYALDFDGVDDGVDTGKNFVPEGEPQSITAWVNIPDQTSAKIVDVSNERFIIAYKARGSTGYEFRMFDGANHLIEYNGPTGQWVHVAATFDGDKQEFYVDGSSVGSDTGTGYNFGAASGDVGIGYEKENVTDYLEGIIDDVRVYDKGLSSSEVSNLYNNGSIA